MEEIKDTPAQGGQERQQIRLDQSQAQTTYSNFLLVSTGAEEFILTFGMHTGDETAIRVNDRVILSPKNAKRLLAAISQAVRLYEEKLGTIDTAPPRAAGDAGK